MDLEHARAYHVEEIERDPNSSQARLLSLVPPGSRVLELGCASGDMTAALQQLGCSVIAVEREEQAAAFAIAHAERVLIGDLDSLDLVSDLEGEAFDVVVAADVLEHLRRPERSLIQAVALLRPGGMLLISLPNVAHAAVRLALLAGQFPYAETGILDRTHLRYYTLESATALIHACGLSASYLERVILSVDDTKVPVDRSVLPPGVEDWVVLQPEALTFQFVFQCHPDASNKRAGVVTEDAEPATTVSASHLLRSQAAALAQMDDTIKAMAQDLTQKTSEVTHLSATLEDRTARLMTADSELADWKRTPVFRVYQAADRAWSRLRRGLSRR